MEVANSPDIFQGNDVLLLTNDTCDDHLIKLDMVLQRIVKAGLNVNATKSSFGKPEIEYLRFWITRLGLKPLAKKVEAIHAIAPPTTCNELRRFVFIINYYCHMWKRRSDLLALRTILCLPAVKWQWTDVEQRLLNKRLLT